MSFSSDLREELIELKMWDNNSSLKQDEQLSRLLIREAFIKKGFINDPNKDYHLEILFKYLYASFIILLYKSNPSSPPSSASFGSICTSLSNVCIVLVSI